jgi:hypothetical protein
MTAAPTSITVTQPPEYTVVVDATSQEVVVTEVAQEITVAASGPQGVAGPTGPAGGTVQLYESSTPPLGAVRGDLWLVTTPLETP